VCGVRVPPVVVAHAALLEAIDIAVEVASRKGPGSTPGFGATG
jgi:hypothetical protein